MKKWLCLLITFIIITIFPSCDNQNISETDSLVFNGEKYSVSSNEWYPYGTITKQDDYLTFDNDDNNIFIRAYSSRVFDGVLYHKDSDIYPSTKTSSVDKLILDCDTKKVKMDNEYASEMINILHFEEKNTQKLQSADMSSDFIFINIYYKNYPAYQCKWMIVKTIDNSLGIMYCEAEENNTNFGRNQAFVIDSIALTEYINNLF